MPVSIIVGGQFGSEGKGKVAYYFAKEKNAKISVRVGGTNSGHTVIDEEGRIFIFRILPTASIKKDVKCILPSGSYIELDILEKEKKMINLEDDRLLIDPNAVIIKHVQKEKEKNADLRAKIGSTLSGTGAAVIDRIARTSSIVLAKDEPSLQKYIAPTKKIMREYLDKKEHIIIEGTQGYGLSVLHSDYYPYVTSRDTTAAAFLSETGLSPFDVENVILVIRAFPIRVSGESGPLPNEIDWDTVTRESGKLEQIIEYTSATNRVRRVARFNPEIIRKAIEVNRPNIIVLNHIDYLPKNEDMLNEIKCEYEDKIGGTIHYFGNSPSTIFEVSKNVFIN